MSDEFCPGGRLSVDFIGIGPSGKKSSVEGVLSGFSDRFESYRINSRWKIFFMVDI